MKQASKIVLGSAGSCVAGLVIGVPATNAYASKNHLDPDALIIGAVLLSIWAATWAVGSVFFAWILSRRRKPIAADKTL